MSVQKSGHRITAPDIRNRKGGSPIVALTSYHAHTAAIIDQHVDLILVGDSLSMVLYGMDSTIRTSLELMVTHAIAVTGSSKKALVVVDMPFGSYEESPPAAFRNAARIMKETGCGAVKLEGGKSMAPTIKFLTERGIPVMAHIGLRPQSSNVMGGFKIQGRNRAEWLIHEEDARAVSEAGAFAVIVEGVVEALASRITRQISAPAIGIGASAQCDGQILVLEDMLGLNSNPPKFVKTYANIGAEIEKAVETYADEVKARSFPGKNNIYKSENS